MADVGEEGGFGPVQVDQCLGTLALIVIRTSIGDGGGQAGSEQVVKAAVRIVHP